MNYDKYYGHINKTTDFYNFQRYYETNITPKECNNCSTDTCKGCKRKLSDYSIFLYIYLNGVRTPIYMSTDIISYNKLLFNKFQITLMPINKFPYVSYNDLMTDFRNLQKGKKLQFLRRVKNGFIPKK